MLHRFACSALLLLASSTAANAGGFHIPDLGATALGRAGAFTARADDPTAIHHNPAGAASLVGTQLFFSGTLLGERIRFTRRQYSDPAIPSDQYPAPLSGTMPTVTNSAGPVVVPLLAFSSDLGGLLKRLRLNLIGGMYAPNGPPARRFPTRCRPGSNPCVPDANGTPSPARYEVSDVDLIAIYPTIGLAWRPRDWLQLGGVLQLGWASASYQTTVVALAPLDTENPDNDIVVQLNTHSGVTPTAIVGLQLRPLRWLALGAALRFRFSFLTKGTLCIGARGLDGSCAVPPETAQLLPIPVDASPNPSTGRLDVPMPWILRSGLRLIDHDAEGRERFDLEVNVVWESWSVVERLAAKLDQPIAIRFADGSVFNEVDQMTLPHAYRNTVSLRIGGTYNIYDLLSDATLMLSGGFYYETATVPKAYTRLDFLPLAHIGISAGLAVAWRHWSLFAAYSYTFSPKRTVLPDAGVATCDVKQSAGCGSQVRAVAPTLFGGDEKRFGREIGNGVFESAIQQLSFGVQIRFGKQGAIDE
ncbi:MAG: outer membrane protein transport protein [Deltaproteobacteria bacterium]|nr:outer membrane protein transport protein [Deltaproteobacteria bacterium]